MLYKNVPIKLLDLSGWWSGMVGVTNCGKRGLALIQKLTLQATESPVGGGVFIQKLTQSVARFLVGGGVDPATTRPFLGSTDY